MSPLSTGLQWVRVLIFLGLSKLIFIQLHSFTSTLQNQLFCPCKMAPAMDYRCGDASAQGLVWEIQGSNSLSDRGCRDCARKQSSWQACKCLGVWHALFKEYWFQLQRFSMARHYFDVLQDKSTSVDALEDWLSSPITNTSQDPIAYWAGMQAAGHPLATMALDFLSIPGKFLSSIVLHS